MFGGKCRAEHQALPVRIASAQKRSNSGSGGGVCRIEFRIEPAQLPG